ncbi:MAG: tyrosine-type recombinase/integrase [Myxococcota bacterium]
MQLYKRGKYWWVNFVDADGQRQRRSTKCTDKRAANEVAAKLQRRAANPERFAQDEATLGQALARSVAALAEEAKVGRKSEATVQFHRKKAGHLVRLFEAGGKGAFLLKTMSARHVDQYISARRGEGASENTIGKELVVLRKALKLTRNHGFWVGDVNAVLPIGFSPAYEPRKRALSEKDVHKLIDQLQPDRAARVAFIVASSASWGPTATARREDISADFSQVHVRGTKRSTRDRIVPILLPAQRELLEFTVENAAGTDGFLFRRWINAIRDIKAACRRAGIEPCSPNDLRRTFAVWLRSAGAPPDLIAPCMGHRDSSMVERVYGRLTTKDLAERLRSSLNPLKR